MHLSDVVVIAVGVVGYERKVLRSAQTNFFVFFVDIFRRGAISLNPYLH